MVGGSGGDDGGIGEDEGPVRGRRQEQLRGPAFQVIILGAGGGPVEDNVTGFLVRSTATNWTKGSVLAVDAGTHLAAIARILAGSSVREDKSNEEDPLEATRSSGNPRRHKNGVAASSRSTRQEPDAGITKSFGSGRIENGVWVLDGPFSGLKVPSINARVNAAYITRELVSTFLITHPHLDHISGFVINTASFQRTARPKRLAALPSTIEAIKTHIFNDVIWPNLSDEEGGVGLISYMRLIEGGSVAIGEGDGRGYIEVCEGLGVRSWMVSHGSCMKTVDLGRNSIDQSQESSAAMSTAFSQARTPSIDFDRKGSGSSYHHHRNRSISTSVRNTPPIRMMTAYDSTAYFIRDDHSGKEILIFGDVEPDSISLSPRTGLLWDQAAPKIVAGVLRGIFIECSYDDSQSDETLFGHLAPRHLIAELRSLGERVLALKEKEQQPQPPPQTQTQVQTATTTTDKRKRKRERGESLNGRDAPPRPLPPDSNQNEGAMLQPNTGQQPFDTLLNPIQPSSSSSSPPPPPRQREARRTAATRRKPSPYFNPHPSSSNGKSADADDHPRTATTTQIPSSSSPPPLEGLQIIIIHIKDPLKDPSDREGGLTIGKSILKQLNSHDDAAAADGADGGKSSSSRLGCTFRISRSGEAVWL